MAKEAILQVRIDAEMKEEAENLYSSLGTSLVEAVRIFVSQSLKENGMPFVISANKKKTYGALADYANPELRKQEDTAMEIAMIKKHEKNN